MSWIAWERTWDIYPPDVENEANRNMGDDLGEERWEGEGRDVFKKEFEVSC